MPRVREKAGDKLPEFVRKYFDQLNDLQEKQIRSRIKSLKSDYDAISFLKKEKSEKHIDDMFYSFEELPPFGKEYWFLKFVSTEENDDRQLLSMFGKSNGEMKVNSTFVGGENGYLASWFFDNGKTVFENGCRISTGEKTVKAENGSSSAVFSGPFGKQNFKLKEGKRLIADLELNPDENMEQGFAFKSFFKLFAGFSLINLYLDAEGELNGKPFKGKTYAQKVIVIGPMVPWYWGRIVFENGSIFTYHLPKVDLRYLNVPLLKKLNFFDAETGKVHSFDGLQVEKTSKGFKIGNNGDEVSAEIETYCSHDFLFEKTGSFNYNEYLGKITDIRIQGIDENKLGQGKGVVEEASGYTI